KFKLFGFGAQLPDRVRQFLTEYDQQANAKRTKQENMKLIVQAIIGVWLVLAQTLHLAEVGMVGLSVIILATSFCGIT
ncbi:sodium/proton antiporter, partial [Yersinia pestis]|nr:sodium/proton antiporter [Yersinia pestis]